MAEDTKDTKAAADAKAANAAAKVFDETINKIESLSVENSVIAMLTDIKAKLDQAGGDAAKVKQLSDALSKDTMGKLAAATVHNT